MLVKVQNVCKLYGEKLAVNDISLEIEEGSFTAILGPNGAGKSTTIQMLVGLSQPSSGQIVYQENSRIGTVFQNSVLDGHLTVKENLEIRAKQYKGIPKKRMADLVEKLGLGEFFHHHYGKLSGGQKRRVDIARALLPKPQILFLDEPTTGLDIQTRQAIWDLLQELQETENLTIVLTTHYLDEADEADMIYIVDKGKMIARGSAQEIKKRYARHYLKIHSKNPMLFEELGEELSVKVVGNQSFLCYPDSSQAALEILKKYEQEIDTFEFKLGSIDDAFMTLTGREVR